MKRLWMSALVMGALLAGVNAANADMCNSDPRDAAVDQNCGLDTGAAWAFAPAMPGSFNPPGRTPSDDIVSYSLSGAYFDNFTDGNGAETLSGTWTVDYTTMTVTALSMTATGAETINISCLDGCGILAGYDTGVFQLYAKNQNGHPVYLVYEATSPISVLYDLAGQFTTNLYDLQGGYSHLTNPGNLYQVPEPASLALLGSAIASFAGFAGLRRRRKAA
jgi:hypothetical protein